MIEVAAAVVIVPAAKEAEFEGDRAADAVPVTRSVGPLEVRPEPDAWPAM